MSKLLHGVKYPSRFARSYRFWDQDGIALGSVGLEGGTLENTREKDITVVEMGVYDDKGRCIMLVDAKDIWLGHPTWKLPRNCDVTFSHLWAFP
jgi:hypothetical protein